MEYLAPKVTELAAGCKRIDNYNNDTIEFYLSDNITPAVTVNRKDATVNWFSFGSVSSIKTNEFTYLLTLANEAAQEQFLILHKEWRGVCPSCAAKDEICNCPRPSSGS